MIKYFQSLQEYLLESELRSWGKQLENIVANGLNPQRFGDLPAWRNVLENLPAVNSDSYDFRTQVRIGSDEETDVNLKDEIRKLLQDLIPWRKGPIDIHGTHIDSEWRSDWKWQRLKPHINDLTGKLVLDVGCGNGYHCWRMLGEGASRVIGVDPSPRFVLQFLATKHFVTNYQRKNSIPPIDVIPATLDDLSLPMPVFDSVFSMGVLYHRPSPIDHLKQLKSLLKPGGQLILETLVIEGELGEILVPEKRYAMMNNVWFIPSALTLVSWLKKLGFKNPRIVDINQTSIKEQRKTDWMHFHSLSDFLDPDNTQLTCEGHPAPVRGIILAEVE